MANRRSVMSNLLDAYAIDAFLPVAKWLAIGVVAAVVLAGLIVWLVKAKNFTKILKILAFSLFVFLLLLGICCLIMEIVKKFSPEYAEENWLNRQYLLTYVLIPLAVLLCSVLASGIALFVNVQKTEPAVKTKTLATILGAINLALLIVAGIMLAVYYGKNYSNDGYFNSETTSVNQPVLYISAALLIVAIIALAFLTDKNKKPLDTRCIAFAGVSVAMSFGLSYIKLFALPQGGSVTLFSLLPVMIFSYVYGTRKGVFICFIYGILQAIQDPWIIHPAQFLLDYPVAFAAIGLSGMFGSIRLNERFPQITFALGGIVASVLRYVSHVFSGVFAFAAYAGDVNPWIYSLGYNSFVFVDIAITLVAGILVFSSKSFVTELKKRT